MTGDVAGEIERMAQLYTEQDRRRHSLLDRKTYVVNLVAGDTLIVGDTRIEARSAASLDVHTDQTPVRVEHLQTETATALGHLWTDTGTCGRCGGGWDWVQSAPCPNGVDR